MVSAHQVPEETIRVEICAMAQHIFDDRQGIFEASPRLQTLIFCL